MTKTEGMIKVNNKSNHQGLKLEKWNVTTKMTIDTNLKNIIRALTYLTSLYSIRHYGDQLSKLGSNHII